jgi:hypothetical protein
MIFDTVHTGTVGRSDGRWPVRCLGLFSNLYALALVLIMAGCGDHAPPPPQPAPPPPAPATPPPAAKRPADDEFARRKPGIAVAVVLDISRSMGSPVSDGGTRRPKLDIAKQAVLAILKQAEKFASEEKDRPVLVSLYTFSNKVRQISPFQPPDPARLEPVVNAMQLDSGTAVGDAVRVAWRDLEQTGLRRLHILVVTDGESNSGERPDSVARALLQKAEELRPAVYLVAFDVDAQIFANLKKSNWSVLPAANAEELRKQLDQTVGEHILLERE